MMTDSKDFVGQEQPVVELMDNGVNHFEIDKHRKLAGSLGFVASNDDKLPMEMSQRSLVSLEILLGRYFGQLVMMVLTRWYCYCPELDWPKKMTP
jgi:hypothetical protein